MKFEELNKKMALRPYFRPQDLHMGQKPPAYELVQLSHWTSEGKIIRLKKGMYTLNTDYRRKPLSALELADPLYRPSYISLEWALSRYGLIPEAAGTVTSVTTLKTESFANAFGTFTYQKLAPAYFFGFIQSRLPVLHFIATAEKALLDFIYLSIPRSQKLDLDLFLSGYRLQNLDRLNKKKLRQALAHFQVPRVQQGGKLILDYLRSKHD